MFFYDVHLCPTPLKKVPPPMVSVCFRACACHNTFVLYLALTRVGLSGLLCSSVVSSVTR